MSRRLRRGDKHGPWTLAHLAQTFLSQAGASRSLYFLLHERYSSGLPPGAPSGREDPRDLLGTQPGCRHEGEDVDSAPAPSFTPMV